MSKNEIVNIICDMFQWVALIWLFFEITYIKEALWKAVMTLTSINKLTEVLIEKKKEENKDE
jgi:hypothetical protein